MMTPPLLTTPVSARGRAQAPPTRHFAGLDGLRAIAVALVIGYHFFPHAVPGGFIGVDVFFVISGFLITSLLVDERVRTGGIHLLRFWQRRVRRLVPALVALVLVCASAGFVLGGDVLVGLGRQVLGAATFSYNWLDIAAGSDYFSKDAPELLRNLWSLAVEEQFYLVWPPAVLALILIRHPWARIAIVVAAAAASAALMAGLYAPTDATRVYFGTDTHSFGLMLGAALALLLPRLKPFDPDFGDSAMQHFVRSVLPPLGVAAFAAVIACAWLLGDGTAAAYRGGLAAVSVATAVLIWAAVTPGSRLGRTLEARPVRAIGKRSYGLYLWHWPVLVLMQAVWPTGGDVALRTLGIGLVASAVTVLAAMASYRFIEQPVRRLGFRRLTRAVVARTRGRRGDRRLAYSALALVALGVAGTAAAIATAPNQTVAQRSIEAGALALKTPPPTVAPAPAPTDATMPTGSDITAIGDSVMLASAPELQRAFPGIAIDAAVSRQMHAAPGLLQSMADAGTLRRVVVIGLGTNGAISDDTLNRIRAVLGPERELVLVTVQAPRPWTDGVNRELRSFAAGHRHSVALADWQSRIAPRLDLLAGDQIHPGSRGGELYASTVHAALEHLVKASWHGWLPRSDGAPAWR